MARPTRACRGRFGAARAGMEASWYPCHWRLLPDHACDDPPYRAGAGERSVTALPSGDGEADLGRCRSRVLVLHARLRPALGAAMKLTSQRSGIGVCASKGEYGATVALIRKPRFNRKRKIIRRRAVRYNKPLISSTV